MLIRIPVIKKKAKLAFKKGRFPEAAKLYQLACNQNPNDVEALQYLGLIRNRQELYSEALTCFTKIIQLNNNSPEAYAGAGDSYLRLGRLDEAVKYCEHALKLNPLLADAYYTLATTCKNIGRTDTAESYYAKTLEINPKHAMAHYERGNMLRTQGKVDEAYKSYEDAIKLKPKLFKAKWNQQKLLPVIFDRPDQIEPSRQKFSLGIKNLKAGLQLDTQIGRESALEGVFTYTNFYLQYQGCDDLELQKEYGDLLTKVMSSNYPQWSRPIERKPLQEGEKIRIGYVSTLLRDHNGAVWLLGWLRNRNRKDFEIYCYHTGTKSDDKTTEFKKNCDHFHHIPADIHTLSEQIISDELHVLIYPELGMDPQNMLTAALRLAPAQCVGWGHPITSGLDTMDYWLSSDLMEPENGQKHYSEELVRLANLANCHSIEQHDRLQNEPLLKSRSDFDLPEEAVLYFCSQSLFKYLPQYDYLWPEIAKKVPDAKFVFLGILSAHVLQRFMVRMENAFKKYDMDVKDYCIMLPRQTPENYLILNKLVDVFLDNPPWSGNNTSMAAVDAHLPIVSYPTEFMRGRHSYAILTMLGIHETIASSEKEFVEIAAKLGNDESYRNQIKQQIAVNHERIYDDVECVRSLEEFYQKTVTRK